MVSTDDLAWTFCFHDDDLCRQTLNAPPKHS